jgi:hypothetical protein
MDKAELRKRIEQFASLQAAHRALARSVHPSKLAAVREQGRNLLIQLQGLSSRFRAGGANEAGAGMTLEQIDLELSGQSARTLEILANIDLTQLRATIPLLAQQHPDEVGGLVDLLLTGDLEDDKILRTLEYLITMLSAEERGGRRVVVKKPSEVRPRLREAAEWLAASAGDECRVAERILEDAVAQLLQQGEIGDTRDRVRRYKEELGSKILHPQVLAATVAYNVAMFNCVAVEIDSSRAIDDLANELFDPDDEVATEAPSSASGAEVLGSRVFEQLVAALRARVIGATPEPGPESGIAALLSLDAVRVQDAEIFSGEECDEADELMRSAITLGLLLRHLAQTQGPLRELGVDAGQLATCCVGDLVARMTDLARKRFADSHYDEAFRLSDVKTHSLAAHALATAPAGSESASPGGSQTSGPAARRPGVVARLRWRVSPSALALGLLALALLGLLFGPPMTDDRSVVAVHRDLTSISPFLEAGRRGRGAEATRFDGRLSSSWDYLGTAERREVATQIAHYFAEIGVTRVSLVDTRRHLAVIYADDDFVLLQPREEEIDSDDL